MREKIKQLLMEIRPDLDFETQKELISAGILNSIDVVDIVVQMGEMLGIEIPPTSLTEKNFDSLDTITLLAEKLT